jgi:hypothetical protein
MAAVMARVIANGPGGTASSCSMQRLTSSSLEIAGAEQLVCRDGPTRHHPIAGEREPDLADEQRHAAPRQRDADR